MRLLVPLTTFAGIIIPVLHVSRERVFLMLVWVGHVVSLERRAVLVFMGLIRFYVDYMYDCEYGDCIDGICTECPCGGEFEICILGTCYPGKQDAGQVYVQKIQLYVSSSCSCPFCFLGAKQPAIV